MIRDTSREAYRRIIDEGLLSKKREQVYAVLYEHGPLTGQEITVKHGIPSGWKVPSQLKELGVVREVGERPCTVTTYNAILWDVTSDIPVKPPKRDKYSELKHLRKRVKELENQVFKKNALLRRALDYIKELRGDDERDSVQH